MRDKPRVEAGVKFVQGNFFAGETFLDLADARAKKAAWLVTANARVHGSTRQVPAAVFAAQEASYGPATGVYARRLLDGDAPWMMMRSVYRLIGLAKRYGPPAAEAACARALDVDVINVSKIESMLKNATETIPAAGLAAAASAGPGRFARDAAEGATATGVRLQGLDRRRAPPP